ncbi:MAG: SDR family NAD(P)-dependent oxidoreductase, partial [Pseudomonas caspiana]
MSITKTALIIGASRGLGLGLVKRLTELNWNVIATVRDPQKASDLKAVDGVQIETLDMDDTASLKALKRSLEGQVFDVLFVNAGVSGPQHQSAAKATAS